MLHIRYEIPFSLSSSGYPLFLSSSRSFDTDYPTDSKITYNWTEHEDKDLKRTLADSILTINGRDSYHIDAQMTEDEEIVFRFSEYEKTVDELEEVIKSKDEVINELQATVAKLEERLRELQEK